MGETSFVQMPLARMVDLVVNSPEEGVVNFNLLQTVLRVLVNHVNANQISVEVQGPTADKLQNLVNNPSATVAVVDVSEKENAKGEGTSVVVVEGQRGSVDVSGTITKTKLDKITSQMEDLKDQVKELIDLPSTSGIIEALKSNTTPVLDMYQILALAKRVDAAEVAMKKMANMVEDVLKNPPMPIISKSRIKQEDTKKAAKGKEKSKEDSEKSSKDGDRKSPKESEATSPPQSPTSKQRSDKSEENEGMLCESGSAIRERLLSVHPDYAIPSLIEEIVELRRHMITIPEEAIMDMRNDITEMQNILSGVRKSKGKQSDTDEEEICNLPPTLQLELMEERFHDYTDHLEQMDQMFNDEITKLQNQFTDIEKDFNEILLKIEGGMPAGDKGMDEPNQCCAAVYQKLVKLQNDFNQLTDTSVALLRDKDEKQLLMDQMLEQIDLLKSVKADREDIEEALADKADACTVHRKVSHDQFDSACDELSKGIEDALEKLTQQEIMWQQALESIQSEIGNKLDKMDLGPLREFINNKLKMLQDRMKSLAAMKKEQEAAGSKSKFLRNVNCISCDKDVVMRKEMDSSLRPQATSVPPTRSMGPYLAYELDSLRKQQKALPGSRNMNFLESALTGAKGGKKGDDHICNRYCGGSHTTTTPQQRVTRLGHFLAQWGNEAIQVESNLSEKKAVTSSKMSISSPTAVSAARSKASNIVEGDIPTKEESKSKVARESSRQSRQGSVSGSAPRGSEGSIKKPSNEGRVSSASLKSKTSVRSSGSRHEKAMSITSNIPEETASQVAIEEGEAVPPTVEGEAAESGEIVETTVVNKSKEIITETPAIIEEAEAVPAVEIVEEPPTSEANE